MEATVMARDSHPKHPRGESAGYMAHPPLALHQIPVATPWCIVREQERGHLLYNPRTDELHLLQPTGYYIYRLCDGLRTVAEVAQELARATGGTEVTGPTAHFLAALVERGLLETRP